MSTYEKLDIIADSFNPIWALLTVILLVLHYIQNGVKAGNKQLVYCLLAVAFVYLLATLDHKFSWWSTFGLDYSTHTALSLSLTVCLNRLWPRFQIGCWLIWLGYLFLMVYQGYHGIMDIITTGIALVILLFILHKIIDRKKNTTA